MQSVIYRSCDHNIINKYIIFFYNNFVNIVFKTIGNIKKIKNYNLIFKIIIFTLKIIYSLLLLIIFI